MSETNSGGDGKAGGRGPGGGGRGPGGPGRGGPRGGMRGSGPKTTVVVEKKRTKRMVAPGSAGSTGAAGAPSSTSARSGAQPTTGAGGASQPRSDARGEAPRARAPQGDGRGQGGTRVEARQDTRQDRGGQQRRGKMLNVLSEEEHARRLRAVEQARRDEAVRRKAE
ncbi:MAG: hypothetical protein AAFN17_06375, partial [Pseudomonadota bacterium]